MRLVGLSRPRWQALRMSAIYQITRECVTGKVGAGGGVRGAGYQCGRIPTCSYKELDSEGAEAQTLIAIKNSQ